MHITSGGSDLARKLIDIYFSLFQLILEGKLGHAADLRAAREQKAAAQKGKGKKGKKPRTFRQPARPASTGQAGKPSAPPTKGQDVSLASSAARDMFSRACCSHMKVWDTAWTLGRASH